MGHALRDSVVPLCYSANFGEGQFAPVPEGEILEGPSEIILGSPGSEECYPSSPEALRSALDAFIVGGAAGAVWLWHLRRARRDDEADPST